MLEIMEISTGSFMFLPDLPFKRCLSCTYFQVLQLDWIICTNSCLLLFLLAQTHTQNSGYIKCFSIQKSYEISFFYEWSTNMQTYLQNQVHLRINNSASDECRFLRYKKPSQWSNEMRCTYHSMGKYQTTDKNPSLYSVKIVWGIVKGKNDPHIAENS